MPNTELNGSTQIKNPWIPFIVIQLGILSIMFILGMIATMLPAMFAELNIDYTFSGYDTVGMALGSAVLAPLMGRLGDMVGAKRAFTMGLLIFAIGCLLLGLSQSFLMIMLGRFVQGVGYACMLPTCMAYISRFIPVQQSGKAFSIFGAVCTGGCTFGPTIAGYVSTIMGWRFVFYCGAAMIAVVFVLALFLMPKIPVAARQQGKFDVLGSIFLFIAVGSFLTMFPTASIRGWTDPVSLALLAAFVLFLIVFLVTERKHPNPLVQLNLFGKRTFGVSAGMYVILAGYSSIFCYIMSYYISAGLGLSATFSGTWIMVLFLLMTVFSGVVSKLMAKLNWRTVAFFPVVALIIACLLFSFCSADTSYYFLFVPAIFLGFGCAFSTPLPSASSMLGVPDEIKGAASGTFRMVGDMGGPLYVAIFVPMLTSIGAVNGIPNFGYSFGKVSLILLIPLVLALILAFCYPKFDPRSSGQN